MRIIKGNKELTSQSLNATLILNEEERKQNEINRKATYDEAKNLAQQAIDKVNDSVQLKTGKFVDRPANPTSKLIYLATDKSSGDIDQYTIYDKSLITEAETIYQNFGVPDITVAKQLANVSGSNDGLYNYVFKYNDTSDANGAYVCYSKNPVVYAPYDTLEGLRTGINNVAIVLRLINGSWVFNALLTSDDWVTTFAGTISSTQINTLRQRVLKSNYSIQDLKNHNSQYYIDGGTDHFVSGITIPIVGDWIWSWHNQIGGSSTPQSLVDQIADLLTRIQTLETTVAELDAAITTSMEQPIKNIEAYDTGMVVTLADDSVQTYTYVRDTEGNIIKIVDPNDNAFSLAWLGGTV
jgi:hypothetical protein